LHSWFGAALADGKTMGEPETESSPILQDFGLNVPWTGTGKPSAIQRVITTAGKLPAFPERLSRKSKVG
jgi:hypothetical protein